MEANKLMLKGLLIAVLGLGLMLAGCAKINQSGEDGQMDLCITAPSQSQSPDDIGPQPFNLTHHPYPEGADYPPEGYQFVPLDGSRTNRSTDDPYDDEWVADKINKSKGGSVWMSGCESGIVIEPWALPYSSWIAMTRPSDDEPWIEFEPHGLVFNSSQYAQVSYDEYVLPPGVDPEDFSVWYWNDELNEYEYIGGIVHPEEGYIEFDIDHFSRYIVACQQ